MTLCYAPTAGATVQAWTDPFTLVLLRTVLVLAGLIAGWAVQAPHARRPRNSR